MRVLVAAQRALRRCVPLPLPCAGGFFAARFFCALRDVLSQEQVLFETPLLMLTVRFLRAIHCSDAAEDCHFFAFIAMSRRLQHAERQNKAE